MHCVVVNYRTPRDLEFFLNSWLQFAPSNATLSVVNVDPLEEDRQVSYRWYPVMVDQGCHVDWLNTSTNVGYGSACCLGVEGRDSEVYGFFNADTKLTSGVLEEMEQALLSNDEWGLIGPRQVDSRGRITHGGILGTNTAPYQRGWQELDRGQYTEVIEDAVSVMGSAFLVKRACWDELHNCRTFREVHPDAPGAFLPTFLYYEETWMAVHARSHGWKAVYYGPRTMIHQWHESIKNLPRERDFFRESRKIFRETCKHHNIEYD